MDNEQIIAAACVLAGELSFQARLRRASHSELARIAAHWGATDQTVGINNIAFRMVVRESYERDLVELACPHCGRQLSAEPDDDTETT